MNIDAIELIEYGDFAVAPELKCRVQGLKDQFPVIHYRNGSGLGVQIIDLLMEMWIVTDLAKYKVQAAINFI